MRLLNLARRIGAEVRIAAGEALESGDASRCVGMGADGTPTEVIDKTAESIVMRHLGESGAFFVLSEEAGGVALSQEPEYIAVVDPIDGSFNALHGLPFYALSIAFSPYSEDASLADVSIAYVLNLHTGDEFAAERGGGAWYNGRRIRSVDSRKLSRATVCVYSTPQSIVMLMPLLKCIKRVRTLGSAALELCHVARGDFDAFVDVRSYLRNVDIAAAKLVVEEAGGAVTDMRGAPLEASLLEIERLNLVAVHSREMQKEIIRILGAEHRNFK
ncbi:bifunctional fructose-bisphosphatase/inositol-phosphate phosphatase [Candidatus Pyrohabitans sp.]